MFFLCHFTFCVIECFLEIVHLKKWLLKRLRVFFFGFFLAAPSCWQHSGIGICLWVHGGEEELEEGMDLLFSAGSAERNVSEMFNLQWIPTSRCDDGEAKCPFVCFWGSRSRIRCLVSWRSAWESKTQPRTKRGVHPRVQKLGLFSNESVFMHLLVRIGSLCWAIALLLLVKSGLLLKSHIDFRSMNAKVVDEWKCNLFSQTKGMFQWLLKEQRQ